MATMMMAETHAHVNNTIDKENGFSVLPGRALIPLSVIEETPPDVMGSFNGEAPHGQHFKDASGKTKGGAQHKGKPALETYSAQEIEHTVFPDPRYAIPGLLPEGLVFLAGPPKIGKSWLALNIALAVALNGKAMGTLAVEAGAVLYLGLEDNRRRMQKRMKLLLVGGSFPANLDISHEATRLGAGLEATLVSWISTHDTARLIVIDTLARVRPVGRRGGDRYQEDSDSVAKLQQLALSHGICILCLHHTRKATSEDFLEEVSGTFGLTGTADAILVLKRARGEGDATLAVTGRDIEESDLAVSFREGLWQVIGSAQEYQVSKERKAILDLLNGSPVPLSPQEVAKALEKNRSTTRTLLQKMLAEGKINATPKGRYCKASVERP